MPRQLKTPIGVLIIEGDELLHSIRFQDIEINRESQDHVSAQLREYFAGERTRFDLELAPDGTDFQRSVWDIVARIPHGETRTYLEIAEDLGDANLVRAVGTANGANPLPIVIPCHRVVGSDGSLTGYSGGLRRKRWFLEHESAQGHLPFL
jgi:methylated-DNA-[protein]-cysteine S-methyltransferase